MYLTLEEDGSAKLSYRVFESASLVCVTASLDVFPPRNTKEQKDTEHLLSLEEED